MTISKQPHQADAPSLCLDGSDGGKTLARVHRPLRERAVSCVAVGTAFLAALGVSESLPLAKALLGICADADRSGRANAYHNPAHSREVGVDWFCLASLHNAPSRQGDGFAPLSVSDLLAGLCAAFGHDLGHDGCGNADAEGAYRPFWLEALAADQVAGAMAAAGASAEDVARVRCAILLTDPRFGYPVLEAGLQPDFDIEQAAAVKPEFAALTDPAVRLISAMLRDADLMPSAAMPARDHDARTREMLIEQGRGDATPDRESTDAFLSGLVGGRFLSPAGARFQPDLDRLRTLNAARGERPGGLAINEPDKDDEDVRETAAMLISALGLSALIGEPTSPPISS